MSSIKVNHYESDVLVIGGGPAGAWAAWSAANAGASVILVDKGYLGSSGATAPGGTNLLYLPPDQELRDKAVELRMKSGGYLAEPRWIYRVLDQVYINLERVEQWGYPFIKDEQGEPQRNHLHGPEYMALMRKQVKKAGVKVLDHAPALELLIDEHGVGGARGVFRQKNEEWEIHAGAVVIATGGCAFLSKGLGCNVLTGDGYLMAGEVGAELSSMEFSRRYAPSPAFSSNTRSRLLGWATYYDENGNELEGDRGGDFLAKRLLSGTVYATLNKADTPEKQAILRSAHTIFFLPYDRAGIDVFKDKFPLTLRYEGTVRGTGGLRIVSDDCQTTVAGLYAAGDAATRERITGAASGGGAFNASWAICSGTWSGEGAAAYARQLAAKGVQRNLQRAGKYGLKRQNVQNVRHVQADAGEGLNRGEPFDGQQLQQHSAESSGIDNGLQNNNLTQQHEVAAAAEQAASVERAVQSSVEPTAQASAEPTAQVKVAPTSQSSAEPTAQVKVAPTSQASAEPTAQVKVAPTSQSSVEPTVQASAEPTAQAPAEPTVQAPAEPTAQVKVAPTSQSSAEPTVQAPADSTSQVAVDLAPRIAIKELVEQIQDQVLPLEINYFRTEEGVKQALARLDQLWPKVQQQHIANVHDVVHAREAAAMAATARWIYTAALARKEKRGGGLHVLAEYPELDPAQQHRIIVSGIEKIAVSYDRSFQEDELYQRHNEKKEVKTS